MDDSGPEYDGAEPSKRHTPDQEAVVDLAKQAKQRGGVTRENAGTLVEWGKEVGFKEPGQVRGPEDHGDPLGDHIHIGGVDHDGTPILTTIAHEREGYLDVSRPEYEELARAKIGLIVHRGEIMPPSAEPYRLFGAFLDEDSLGANVGLDSALAKHVSIASPASVEEVIAAIRHAVFTLKDDALLQIVLQRWGAAPTLVAGVSPSSVLKKIADTLEQRRAAQQ
jgi:hypothetical protein